MDFAARRFLDQAIFLLRDQHLPRIREAVNLLADAELWERQSESTNSVGNLLLHLSGNVRQHILSGVGGRLDERVRKLEFAARGGISREVLLGELERTVTEACAVLSALDPALLLEERVIQNQRVALLDDIFHVVEHFAYHAGQIIHLVKARKDHRFPWYQHLENT